MRDIAVSAEYVYHFMTKTTFSVCVKNPGKQNTIVANWDHGQRVRAMPY